MESGDRDNAVAVNEERDERIATELRMRPLPDGLNTLQFYREKHL